MATSGQYEKQKEKQIQPHNSAEKKLKLKRHFVWSPKKNKIKLKQRIIFRRIISQKLFAIKLYIILAPPIDTVNNVSISTQINSLQV